MQTTAPAELEARFVDEKKLRTNSTFYNRAQAEAAASRTLATNEAKIGEWLASPASDNVLRLEYHPSGPSFPVGVHMARGAAAVPVAGVRIVLIKDTTMVTGFRIVTGSPIP